MFPVAKTKYFAATLLGVDDRVMVVIMVELSSEQQHRRCILTLGTKSTQALGLHVEYCRRA